MADDNKSGLSEVAEKSANTAHAIRGAVKTGKAIAAASKGAAAGGPYGAVAGALWANRKHIGKIIIVVTAILLIPILFLLMLPLMIFNTIGSFFGGIFGGGTETAPPIMNDNVAIVQNVNDISFAVNSVLSEGLDDVIVRIDSDFASSGGDCKEIVNPYESDMFFNGNLFVSQYCASKNTDYESIKLSDMESVLRGAKDKLYSYTRREEIRERTEVDPENEEETTISETWMIYTIVYNGEAYFADNIFHLTEEQKELSYNYAQNMSLFMGDGMFQGLASSEYIAYRSYAGIVFSDGVTAVTYYNQLDERYADKPYGTDHIGGYGCGPTSMAIVVSSLTSSTVDPVEMAKWAYDNGYWCSKSGSYHALIPAAAKHWSLPIEGCTASEPQRIVDALAQGKLVVALMAKGHFTKSGHFLVIRGVTSDGKVLVADPASYSRSEKQWDLSILLNEASKNAAAGGPFWIIG